MIIRPRPELPAQIGNLSFWRISAEVNQEYEIAGYSSLLDDGHFLKEIGIIMNKRALYAAAFLLGDNPNVWTRGQNIFLYPTVDDSDIDHIIYRKDIIEKYGERCPIPWVTTWFPYTRLPGTKINGLQLHALLQKTWNDCHKTQPQI